MPNASLLMSLYLHTVLVRLLHANTIGLRMVLSGAVSFGQVISSLVCNRAVSSPIPYASVSRYKGLVSS